ncbi:3-oxoacyl-(acyl-carrier-protein) reductase FabG [Candidatus Sulfopaludibacter sp. SbA3]|nr:3-oxoacyl-(acyl-carrier-protein) reductase FabG [Candidatus Sulfopaludibacter sp. SbA3]
MELKKLFDLSGQVALVTGGSRGLGEEIATGLAEAGASLMLLARREAALTETVERLRGQGFRCEGSVCDAASGGDVRAAVEKTLEIYGYIDTLVNNAGITWGAPAEEMPLEKWQAVLDVNLTGAFLFARAVAPHMMARRRGSILNVTSIAGLRAMPQGLPTAGYVASKGGLIALTRELAAEWAPYGIRVNAIAPGFFPSRMTQKVLERLQTGIESGIPMGRIGRPGELKGAAVFLVSEAASYITGQTLAIDGGTTAR